jgi:hypothetical protein
LVGKRWNLIQILRQSFSRVAALSITQSQWARAYYELQCRRGKRHHAAVRALAFKWIRIIYRCWKERVAYDENVYLAALAKHNSPLVTSNQGGGVVRNMCETCGGGGEFSRGKSISYFTASAAAPISTSCARRSLQTPHKP